VRHRCFAGVSADHERIRRTVRSRA
jgi:hypothetical protein